MILAIILSHVRKWLSRAIWLVLILTLSCGGGGGGSPEERPRVTACLIEGKTIDCLKEGRFILNTVTPTAEIQFSKPIRTETASDNVRVCAESLLSGRGVSAPLRSATDVAAVEWVGGNTRLQLHLLGNEDVQLRDGSVGGMVVTLTGGVLSSDGQSLEPVTIGPLLFEIDLTGRGGQAIATAGPLRFCAS